MKINKNKRMEEIFSSDLNLDYLRGLAPKDLIEDTLHGGFKEVNGAVVYRNYPSKLVPPSSEDQTEFEAQLSKVTMIDSRFVSSEIPLKEMTEIGLGYGLLLCDALIKSNIKGGFQIIISASSEEGLNNSAVRFHRMRETLPWLLPNLDQYDQPVAMIEI